MGLDAYHPPDLKPEIQKLRGRPDLLCLGGNIVIEVKRFTDTKEVEPSIHLSDISDPQRKWLDWWVHRKVEIFGHEIQREAYIALGTQKPFLPEKHRELFVIPWPSWIRFEKVFANDGKDAQVYLKTFRANFGKYMWIYGTGTGWTCPETHPIFSNPFRSERKSTDNDQLSLRFNNKEDR